MRELNFHLAAIEPFLKPDSPINMRDLAQSISQRTLAPAASPPQAAAGRLLIEILAQPEAFPLIEKSIQSVAAPGEPNLGAKASASLERWAHWMQSDRLDPRAFRQAFEPLREALSGARGMESGEDLRARLDALFSGASAAPPLRVEQHLDFEARPREREFALKMTEKLLESPEGRRILGETIDEYKRRGQKILIHSQSWPRTRLASYDGVEQILGASSGESLFPLGEYHFNRAYLEMKNRDLALESAASVMGHELRHLWLHANIRRVMPEYAGVFQLDLANEQSARLKGYLVAWEINRGRPSQYILESQELLGNPPAYWELIKVLDPGYVLKLDSHEMFNPLFAYRSRLQALKRVLSRTKDGSAIKGLKESIAAVRRQTNTLRVPKGRELIARMKQAALDPRYRAIWEGLKKDLAKLRNLAAFGTNPRAN